ncbi:ABC transporter permease [Pradoshia sp.]
MSQLMQELKVSLWKKRTISILLYIVMTCLLLMISVLYVKWFDVDTKTESYLAQYEGQNIYQLSDELTGEREEAYWDNPAELDLFKKIYRAFSMAKQFSYVISNSQAIGIQEYKGNERLLDGYEDNAVQPEYMGYSFPKAIQINQEGIERFIRLSEGNLPETDNYIYKENTPIPVLLGSEYANTYNVGDELTISYLNYPFKAVISGILEKDVMIPNNGELEFYLDRYIVLPFLDFPEPKDAEFFSFQQKHYLNAINGDIYTPADPIQTRLEVEEITDKVGFSEYQIIGANDSSVSIFISMLKQNKMLLLTLVSILAAFTVLGITIASLGKWNLNINRYATYLISGATYRDIFTYLFVEMFLILFLSICTTFVFISLIGTFPPVYYMGLIVVGILLLLFGLIPLVLQMKRMNLVQLLKKV